jgi:hypothetical protein
LAAQSEQGDGAESSFVGAGCTEPASARASLASIPVDNAMRCTAEAIWRSAPCFGKAGTKAVIEPESAVEWGLSEM